MKMNPFRNRGVSLACLVMGLFLVSMPDRARAQENEGAVKLTAQDVPVFLKLRYAQLLADQRQYRTPDAQKREALTAEADKAITDAGWTRERYDGANQCIDSILQALDDIDRGGEDAQNGRSALEYQDKGARQALAGVEQQRQQAEQQVRSEAEALKRGRAPKAGELAGTWVFDLDATVDSMVGGASPEVKQSIRQQLEKTMGSASYTFGPGDSIVSTMERVDGKGQKTTQTDKGTYRLDGNTLYVKANGSSTEHSLEIGLQDENTLNLGMMKAYSVFKKQK